MPCSYPGLWASPLLGLTSAVSSSMNLHAPSTFFFACITHQLTSVLHEGPHVSLLSTTTAPTALSKPFDYHTRLPLTSRPRLWCCAGFQNIATAELCARWISVGAWQPFTRDHHAQSFQELYR